jgi:hypothetical protein
MFGMKLLGSLFEKAKATEVEITVAVTTTEPPKPAPVIGEPVLSLAASLLILDDWTEDVVSDRWSYTLYTLTNVAHGLKLTYRNSFDYGDDNKMRNKRQIQGGWMTYDEQQFIADTLEKRHILLCQRVEDEADKARIEERNKFFVLVAPSGQ